MFNFVNTMNVFLSWLILFLLTSTGCKLTPINLRGKPRAAVKHSNMSLIHGLSWPVKKAVMTRGYFYKSSKKKHFGLDLASRLNAGVYAAHAGKVIYSGRKFSGYGKLVILEGANGWSSFYAHLNRHKVKEGQIVKKGDLLGLMGRTGRATGVHLHFELLRDKLPVDPMKYLPVNKSIRQR